jgi:hypothetical protein
VRETNDWAKNHDQLFSQFILKEMRKEHQVTPQKLIEIKTQPKCDDLPQTIYFKQFMDDCYPEPQINLDDECQSSIQEPPSFIRSQSIHQKVTRNSTPQQSEST